MLQFISNTDTNVYPRTKRWSRLSHNDTDHTVRPHINSKAVFLDIQVGRQIARSEIQMGTGNESLNFNLIKKSHERSCKN